VILVCSLVALCFSAPTPCCTVDQFESAFSFYDQDQKEFIFGWTAYDYTNLREFSVIFSDVDYKDNNATVINFYANNTGYVITFTNGKNECKKIALNQQMTQFCVPNNAQYLNTVTIGGSLSVDNWSATESSESGFLSMTSTGCIPVSYTGVFSRYNVDNVGYVNYVAGISNSSIFNVPAICQNQKKSRLLRH